MPTKKPTPKKAAKPVAKAAVKKAAPKKAAKAVAKKATEATSVGKKSVSAAPAKKVPAKPETPVKTAQKASATTVKPTAKPAPKAVKTEEASPKVVAIPVVEQAKPVVKKVEEVKEVKLPKTSVKTTSVPVAPDNKTIEQSQNSPKNYEALVRYNDADLAEFRELINKKMEAAKKELNYLQGLITRKDDMGGDESESRYMTMEDGSMSMEREQLSQMASRQITYVDHLEKALIRIENKTYGICRVTGKLIDKARLRAVPHATLSLEAKLGLVKPSGE